MVNKIKNNSTQGLYILADQGGWVAANTPGEADLDSLVLGTSYIYFASLIRLESSQTHNHESDLERGFKSWADGEGTRDLRTGGAEKQYLLVTVEEALSTVEYMESFAKYRNRTARTDEIYLVRQKATTTFRQFPNQVPTLKKYCPVLIRGVNSIETGNIDKQTITLVLEVVW